MEDQKSDATASDVKVYVAGQAFDVIPEDLFIPPDALEVLLDEFSGPLDLLLYLIRKQNLDILNIPMRPITEQYLQYIQLMKQKKLELAADYLVMAALLIEIKSKMLLPRTPTEDTDLEEDPRMDLVRRLQLYEHFKHVAEALDELPRMDRDFQLVNASTEHLNLAIKQPEVSIEDLMGAFEQVLELQGHLKHHHIARESLSVRERMASILETLQQHKLVEFSSLFKVQEGRQGLVVSFIAILELAKQAFLSITQREQFAPIHLKGSQDG